MTSWYARRGKRILDLAFVISSAPITFPLIAAGWSSVRLLDGAPGFFKQVRVGRGSRPFELWKLRTMRAEDGSSITIGADRRITPVGRVLRRSKLDELPQLWNVLRGDMSIVGPRPEVPAWVDRFRDQFDDVLTVRPGLTDLASIIYADEADLLAAADDGEAFYAGTVLPNKLELGRLYASRHNLMLDLRIMALTIVAVVSPARARAAALRQARLGESPGIQARGEGFPLPP